MIAIVHKVDPWKLYFGNMLYFLFYTSSKRLYLYSLFVTICYAPGTQQPLVKHK